MILLTGTSDIIELITGASLSTDWTAGWVDIGALGVTFAPGSAQGNVATATTTQLVPSPASGINRQVKFLSVRNRDASSSQTVTIVKSSSSTVYRITADITLAPGEYMTYIDSDGFEVFDSSGRPKIIAPIIATGILALAGSNTTYTSGTVSLVNANGISFGSSGVGGISASYTVPTQSNQTLGAYGVSNTTLGSSGTIDARSLSFEGAGGVSVGVSNGSIVISGGAGGGGGGAVSGSNGSFTFNTLSLGDSNGFTFYTSNSSILGSYTVPTQSNQTEGRYAVSNTTLGTSGTADARTLSYAGAGEVSVGVSNGSIVISAPPSSVGVSNVGNTSGNTGTYSGQVVLSGGNNITLGVSTGAGGAQTIQISGANAAGAQTGISGIVVSNTTYTSGTVTFQNANGISFGSSGANGISASYTVPTQSNQTEGYYVVGNTTLSSSGTMDARTQSLSGAGEVSIGVSNGSIVISAPPSSVGVSNIGNTSGNTGTYSGQVVFSGGNNITLGVSTAAGGAQTIQVAAAGAQTGISGIVVSNTTYTSGTVTFQNANGISFGSSGANGISASYTVPTQSNQTIGAYAVSNTTNSSSGTIDARSLSFKGAGNVSVGVSNGSIVVSGATAAGLTTGGFYAVNNTTGQSSSSTIALTALSLYGDGIISVGYSGGSIVISAPASTTGVFLSAGMSTLGNTAGTSGMASAQLVFAGVNATLSQSNSSGSATLSISVPGTSSLVGTNGLSVSVNGSTISVSLNPMNLYAVSNTTQSTSMTANASALSFEGAGGVSVGMSNGSVVISGGAGGGGGLGGIQVSNTTYTSGTVTFQNANGISFGSSGANGISASYTVPTQSNQTEGYYVVGNTTLSSSGTMDARTQSLSGAGEVSIGVSNGSIVISAPPSSVGVSNIGNTSGNTGTYSGQVVLSGGNNITLGVSTAAGGAQTIQISGANAGGAQTGISGIVVSNTTYTSGTVTFQNANGISFGSSGANGISASLQADWLLQAFNTSATVGILPGTSSKVYLSNSNNVSFGLTITNVSNIIATASYALNVSDGGVNSNALSGLTFANSNGVSFGLSTGAGVGTITASVAGGGGGQTTGGLYALGNTTQNSSTTLALSAYSLNGLGAMTVGFSNGSVQLSAPATSSLQGTNGVSISVNGSTISVGLSVSAASLYMPVFGTAGAIASNWQNSLFVCPMIQLPHSLSVSRFNFLQNIVEAGAITASSGSQAWTYQVGIYTCTGSTLSRLSSASQSYSVSDSTNTANASLVTGARLFSVPLNFTNGTGGDYWLAVVYSSGNTGASSSLISGRPALYEAIAAVNNAFVAYVGSAPNASVQYVPGLGLYSATTGGLPSSIPFSAIVQSGTGPYAPMFTAINYTA